MVLAKADPTKPDYFLSWVDLLPAGFGENMSFAVRWHSFAILRQYSRWLSSRPPLFVPKENLTPAFLARIINAFEGILYRALISIATLFLTAVSMTLSMRFGVQSRSY